MADRGQEPRRRFGDDDTHGGRRDRRRSRSPAPRADRRGGAYGEVDSYSSSRNYREREREDRYTGRDSGRDRRDRDRDWDRDRDRGSARRDARRDDDGRRRPDPRRDRDRDDVYDRRPARHDDRRDRDRDHGRDREDMRQLERQTAGDSPAPDRKPKEPTPPLDDVVSILDRKRRMTMWDIKPQGYENITAENAKLSGMFPLPGAPGQRAQPDPARLQAFMNQPGNQASAAALKPSTARSAKRVFVSNLPASVTDDSLVRFFNELMNPLNVTRGLNPCALAQGAQISKNQTAMVEFLTPEDATTALAFDGIQMASADVEMSGNGEANGSGTAPQGLRFKRPDDYIAPVASDETEHEAGVLSGTTVDTPTKLVVHHLPAAIDEDQVLELLNALSAPKTFALVRDKDSASSRGFAFVDYGTDAATEQVIQTLNGVQIGDEPLVIKRACVGLEQNVGPLSVTVMSGLATGKDGTKTRSRVLCLLNMVTREELMNADECEDIISDVKSECAKYGTIHDIKMPRPTSGSRQSNGVGKIYIKYDTAQEATKALSALAGRKFDNRTVVGSYFSEESFDVSAW